MPYPYFNYPQAQNFPQNQGFAQQQSGFIPVSSEEVARNYPVAPGNSMTFKNENAPYVYTKTMGFSQLDRPVFEKYKLVREDTPEPSYDPQIEKKTPEVDNGAIEELKGEIQALWDEVNAMKNKKPTRKKEVSDDDAE